MNPLTRVFNNLNLLPFLLSLKAYKRVELVVVTGSDSSHARSLFQLLTSLYAHEPKTKTIVFDLGLTDDERSNLPNCHPEAEIRTFHYSNYPSYFNIKKNAGEYAWKPAIFAEVFNEFRSHICWMDAGNVVTGHLFWIRRILSRVGFYSPHSVGSIHDWTHSGTLSYMKVSETILSKRNYNGACVCASYHHPIAREIIAEWRKLAFVKDCIAPPGSNRLNHRQDQAILSVLLHQSDLSKRIPARYYNYKIHQDCD